MNHKHGCVIVYNNTIIAQGTNHMYCNMKEIDSIHAEVNAINQLRKMMARVKDKHFFEKCELYVVRIGTSSMDYPLKESSPCEHCTKIINRVGIKKVYYSTNYEFDIAYDKYILQKMEDTMEKGRPISGRPMCVVC